MFTLIFYINVCGKTVNHFWRFIKLCLTRVCAWLSKRQRNSPDNITMGKLTVQSRPSWKRFDAKIDRPVRSHGIGWTNGLHFNSASGSVENTFLSDRGKSHLCRQRVLNFRFPYGACNKSIARNRSTMAGRFVLHKYCGYAVCFFFCKLRRDINIHYVRTRDKIARCVMHNVFVLTVNFFF